MQTMFNNMVNMRSVLYTRLHAKRTLAAQLLSHQQHWLHGVVWGSYFSCASGALPRNAKPFPNSLVGKYTDSF